MNDVVSLRDRLSTLVAAMEYEFVGCELLRQGKNSLLRIYIDRPDGVTVDDCAAVSHQVSAMLDVEDPISGRYTLEVSSPGLERPLFEKSHYEKFVGECIKVRLMAPLNNRRNWTGTLIAVDSDSIQLLVDQEKIEIAFSTIEKANLSPVIKP